MGRLSAIVLTLVLATVPARAAEITFLCTNALKSVVEELGAKFEKATGHKLKIHYTSTGPGKALIEKGDPIDVAILGSKAIDDVIKSGKLVGTTRTVIARSSLGVTVRKGAPKPDISTTEKFKQAMLNSKSIAYTKGGLTGDYLKGLFERLGIAQQMAAKTVFERSAEAVAEGKAEIGITQISEILPIAGAELVGPMPKEIQDYAVFAGAVSAHAKQVNAATALLKYLTAADAGKLMKAKGLEPGA